MILFASQTFLHSFLLFVQGLFFIGQCSPKSFNSPFSFCISGINVILEIFCFPAQGGIYYLQLFQVNSNIELHIYHHLVLPCLSVNMVYKIYLLFDQFKEGSMSELVDLKTAPNLLSSHCFLWL